MNRQISTFLSGILVVSMLLQASSCSKQSDKEAKKIQADAPWFNCNTYDIDPGTDPDREIEDCYLNFLGADEKYLVVYSRGEYEGTMDEKYADKSAFEFNFVTIIDRDIKSVVNSIDVNSLIDGSSNEPIDRIEYTNGLLTVTVGQKETDYNPATAEAIDTRSVTERITYPIPDVFTAGDYTIEALTKYEGNERGCDIKIKSSNGDAITSKIRGTGTYVEIRGIIPLSDTEVLIYGNTPYRKYFELDLTNGNVSPADEQDYEWLGLDEIKMAIKGTDGKLYCRTGKGVLRADTTKKTSEEFFNTGWCLANCAKINRFELADCSEDTLLFVGEMTEPGSLTGAQSCFQVIELTKAVENPNAGKTVLELYAPYISEDIGAAIEKFNGTDKHCFIEVVDRYDSSNYTSDKDLTEGSEEDWKLDSLRINSLLGNDLAMDIIAGKGPDILIGTSLYSQLNDPDYLADLSKYVKKLDSELYFTNIIEGSKNNGALYQLPVSFFVEGICTDKKYAGNTGAGFTLDEYGRFVNETLNGTDILVSSQPFYFADLINSMDDRFISNGKADFGGPEFAAVAEFVKENVPENGTPREKVYQEAYKYAQYDEVQSYAQFYYQKKDMRGLDGFTILGIPSVDGRGPLFSSVCSVAVSSHAVNVDACGEFVRLLLSDEIQTSIAMSGIGLVLNRDAFRNAGEAAITYCNNLDDDFEGNKMKFTTADIDNLERIILSCSRMKTEDPDISMILIEEMPAYFLDQKDLDAVIMVAQDRVQKVLDERG